MAKRAIKDIEDKQEEDAMKEAFKTKKKRAEQETLNKLSSAAKSSQGSTTCDAHQIDLAIVSLDCDTAIMSPTASSITTSPFGSVQNSCTKNGSTDYCAGDYCCVSEGNMVSCTITCVHCNGHYHEKCSTKKLMGTKLVTFVLRSVFKV